MLFYKSIRKILNVIQQQTCDYFHHETKTFFGILESFKANNQQSIKENTNESDWLSVSNQQPASLPSQRIKKQILISHKLGKKKSMMFV